MKLYQILPVAILVASPALAVNNNEIYIDQTGPNYAESFQECAGDDCNNKGSITQVYADYPGGQVGPINNASLKQYTSGTTANITQVGSNNVADVAQRNGSGAVVEQINSYDSIATINQNQDLVDQTLAGENNWASAKQTGFLHVSLIKQFGDNGEAHTEQHDDLNHAKIIQNAGSNGEYAYIYQEGWGNSADVVENGQGDVVALSQSGMKNNLDVDVAASSVGSAITADQVGSFNNAKLYTQGTGNIIDGFQNDTNNYVEVVQLGNDQEAYYYQDGVDNNAFIAQYETATGSAAGINQYGTGHNAAIYQHSANSIAQITQNGSGANAVVTQQ